MPGPYQAEHDGAEIQLRPMYLNEPEQVGLLGFAVLVVCSCGENLAPDAWHINRDEAKRSAAEAWIAHVEEAEYRNHS